MSDEYMAEFCVPEEEGGLTVGDFLRLHGVSRRLIVKLKRMENGITLDGEHIRSCDPVIAGGVIRLITTEGEPLNANPKLYVPVIYEDRDVVVFDKPAGMPVHPSHKHRDDTLGNYFAAAYPKLTFRPINRLDRDTSGLCAVAKNSYAADRLGGTISKVYYAVLCGNPGSGGIIDAPIGREGESVIKRMVRPDGKRAVTEYTIIKANDRYSLAKVQLHTGRTHQIRVHFSHIGYPLAGDDLYGGSTEDLSVQALHCGEMSFEKVSTGEVIKLSSPIRKDMEALFDKKM
ncbi:MAG: RluA family pseudouridine synthase [Huintestinicola sp.]